MIKLHMRANNTIMTAMELGESTFFSSLGRSIVKRYRKMLRRLGYEYVPSIAVGLHLDVRRCDIEIFARADQLKQMLQRTAETWRELGASEPHWSVLTHDKYRTARIESTKEAFYRTGYAQISTIDALLRRNGFSFPKNGTCLDFGCGVGRLSLAIAPHFRTVVGVDVSATHLKHAIEQQQQTRISNVSFTTIGEVEDIDRLSRFDMLVSFIVLQHNPPPVIATILDRLLSRLNAGGLAVFQLPTFIAGYRFSIADYLASSPSTQMEMHALPQRHVYDILDRNACRLIEVREDTYTGSAAMVSQTFFAQKRAS